MSHERTVGQLVGEIDHVTGVKVKIRRIAFSGTYLEDTETGNTHALGMVTRNDLLTPEEQESICRGLHREHWLVLLGLRAED